MLISFMKPMKIYTQTILFKNQLFFSSYIVFNVCVSVALSPQKRDKILRTS